MKTETYADALAVPGESEILERLAHLVRPDERRAVSIVGVANEQGVPRLRIVAYTEAEEEAVIGILERRNYRDALEAGHEHIAAPDEGTAEIIHGKHPDFDYLFVPQR